VVALNLAQYAGKAGNKYEVQKRKTGAKPVDQKNLQLLAVYEALNLANSFRDVWKLGTWLNVASLMLEGSATAAFRKV
jgi:hypothetical protein